MLLIPELGAIGVFGQPFLEKLGVAAGGRFHGNDSSGRSAEWPRLLSSASLISHPIRRRGKNLCMGLRMTCLATSRRPFQKQRSSGAQMLQSPEARTESGASLAGRQPRRALNKSTTRAMRGKRGNARGFLFANGIGVGEALSGPGRCLGRGENSAGRLRAIGLESWGGVPQRRRGDGCLPPPTGRQIYLLSVCGRMPGAPPPGLCQLRTYHREPDPD